MALLRHFQLTADAQLIDNPGYNRDRGPVPVLALRLHGQL
jgi:high affinity Mn2+ porin